jgi:hypothetical protein
LSTAKAPKAPKAPRAARAKPAAIVLTAGQARRKRRQLLIVSVASFGLLSGFLITPAANAEESNDSFVAAFRSDPAQTVSVASGFGGASISRDGYGVTVQETAKPVVPAMLPGASTNADWAGQVLIDGGWPTSANNVTALLQWMDSENAPESWYNRNNPLNNGYGSGGGAGFGSYPDLTTAAQYAADLLHANSAYSDIIAALAASAPVETTVDAIQGSPWASSHYGYGSLWHAVDVPVVAAPESDW